MSTDTGHISEGLNGSWAINAPESVIDWGYRAMHGSVVLSKVSIPTVITRSMNGD